MLAAGRELAWASPAPAPTWPTRLRRVDKVGYLAAARGGRGPGGGARTGRDGRGRGRGGRVLQVGRVVRRHLEVLEREARDLLEDRCRDGAAEDRTLRLVHRHQNQQPR